MVGNVRDIRPVGAELEGRIIGVVKGAVDAPVQVTKVLRRAPLADTRARREVLGAQPHKVRVAEEFLDNLGGGEEVKDLQGCVDVCGVGGASAGEEVVSVLVFMHASY